MVLSTRARIIVLAVIAGSAGGLYSWWPRPSVVPSSARGMSKEWNWYKENLPTWEAFEYVALDDPQAVADTVRELVQQRAPGPEIDEELLIRDLSTFLYAQGATSPDEYLERIAPVRKLRSNVFSDAVIHHRYRIVTGRAMPGDIDARAALQTFWNTLPDAPGRPVTMSRAAAVQVARSKPIPAGRDPDANLYALTYPRYSYWQNAENRHWVGSYSQGFPNVTVPTKTFEQVLDKYGSTLVAMYHWAARTNDDRVFTLGTQLYFSPDEARWHVQSFGTYYPDRVIWPF